MLPAQANLPLPAGFRLEQYRIERQIAYGGFSIVYLAYDAADMPVAIKEFLPQALALRVGDNAEPVVEEAHRAIFNQGLKCFFEEGRTLTLLDHPNVVRAHNFFRANDTAYLVMAYERGRTLREHVKHHKGPLPEDFLRGVFAQLLDGLSAVHACKLLHLDIKPANVFLRSDGTPVLLDFGAARQTLDREFPQLQAIHTPGFAAPEQYGSNGELGPWTDIYGVGASLYYCLASVSPPAADRRARNDELPPAAQRWKGRYSAHLLETVDMCMRLDARERPQDVAALREELGQLQPAILTDSNIWGALRHKFGALLGK